ncbi:hypothetical protein DPMN_044201 [Dreissena polymorpha]|uniref:Uncharacterized protein n=1 Tax=Dreissena polymorpha TaxID=45954 RepID=A0A9D4D1Z0_DREPO|nr:hypothetical protein DPMN_044201 [Dreissena polymorpha]
MTVDCVSHVFQLTGIIFEIFHEDQTINVASRVNKMFGANQPTNRPTNRQGKNNMSPPYYSGGHKNAPHLCGHVFQVNISIFKLNQNAPPPGGHVFSSIWTIFKLVRDIDETNVSTKFNVLKRNTAPPTGGHTNILTKLHEDLASNVNYTVFTSFELSQGINGTSVLTKFHEDRNRPLECSQGKMLTTHDTQRTKSNPKSSL